MHNSKITGIMACDPHGVIALNNRLPWHYPEDVEFYRKTIYRQNVILGYNTFIEMPDAFFESHSGMVFSRKDNISPKKNVIFISGMQEFKQIQCPANSYMIGGAEIAKLFLQENLLDNFLLTIINKEYPGDKFFPLAAIASWPKKLIKSNQDFSIYQYTNPQGTL